MIIPGHFLSNEYHGRAVQQSGATRANVRNNDAPSLAGRNVETSPMISVAPHASQRHTLISPGLVHVVDCFPSVPILLDMPQNSLGSAVIDVFFVAT